MMGPIVFAAGQDYCSRMSSCVSSEGGGHKVVEVAARVLPQGGDEFLGFGFELAVDLFGDGE